MTNPTGPWSLIRQMWTRNFQQKPAGTVFGSLLAVGALGLMLFFGFFLVLTFVVVGALFMLAQTLLGGPRRATLWTQSSRQGPASPDKASKNNAIEGEFTVVSDERSRQRETR